MPVGGIQNKEVQLNLVGINYNYIALLYCMQSSIALTGRGGSTGGGWAWGRTPPE